MLTAFRQLRRRPNSTPRPSRRRLLLETLENRSLLAAVAPPDGMVSWWTGDITTDDLIGPNDGTLFSGAYVAGQVASGFNFDGIDDNLQAPTVGLPTGSDDRTIELWARIDQPVAGEAFFASYGAPGSSNQVYTLGSVSDGRVFVSTWGPAITGPVLENNRWYHVAATNAGTSFKLYLDGVEVAAGNMPVDTPAGSTFWMGRQTMTSIGDFRRLDGMVDEVTVYNRALTSAEINAIYSAGSDGKIKNANYLTADFPSVVEGTTASTALATFTISRMGDLAGETIVNWATADGTATAGSDYVASSGQVLFQEGQSQMTVAVTVNGDDIKEPKESFNLVLATPTPGYGVRAGKAAILNDDFLVSHWTADNTAVDAVGLNHGTLISGATYADGQIGRAFSFDGVNDRVQVADSESLKLTESLTIEAWVRADTPFGGPILHRGDDRGGLDPYSLAAPNGAIHFQVTSLSQQAVLKTTLPVGQFVHIAGTLDNATGAMRLYVNGVQMAQMVTTVRPFRDLDPTRNPAIGIGNTGGYPSTPHNFPFDGLIDELKLYDRPLTAEEVLGIFNAGKGDLQPAISVSDVSVIEGEQTIKYLGNLVSAPDGGLNNPNMMIYGPDGDLYVSTTFGNSVLHYDAATGMPVPAAGKPGAEFVSPGAGGLDGARGLAFGPDGHLYVVGSNSDAVLRYHGVTGEPLGALVSAGSGGLDQPRGLLFHTDGFLYVTSVGGTTLAAGQDSILRYDAATGAPAGISELPDDAVFIESGTGGLDNPSQIVFYNGSFYVASTATSTSNSVLRFGTDGSFLGAFVPTGSGGLSGPIDLNFRDGFLYVTSMVNSKVLRYSAATGAFVDEVVNGGGLFTPRGMLFEQNGNFLVASGDSNEIRRYGESSDAVITVSLSPPFPTTVSVSYATADGSANAGSDYTAASGTITFAPGQTTRTILVQIIDDATIELPKTFSVNLSSPVGAVIADGLATGTILDNDTKFYVVDDAAANRTFEYGSGGGAAGENYVLNTGNTAPRGAASTATGDKVWVVDANRNVYVYDAAGVLLGSWTATAMGLSQPEGIATNGADIWIVDASADKVFKFAGAASRLTGTQNAPNNANFKLNNNNKDATDIVTDGASFWVVNNAAGANPDKVFKYSLSGNLQGSWTIPAGGGSPTGITIDPSDVSHVWIVDSSSDRIYQFDNAAGTTSGSLSPNPTATFLLAPSNTNPQGLADPPTTLLPLGEGGRRPDECLTALHSALPARGTHDSGSSELLYDHALLSIIHELQSFLTPAKRRR